MKKIKSETVVVGSGPGGEGAAMQLAKGGKQVTMVERHDLVGGGCTHWNTIPSKALRFSIYQVTEALQSPLVKSLRLIPDYSLADLRARTATIVNQQQTVRKGFYQRNRVDVLCGEAEFIDSNSIRIGNQYEIEFEHIVLATGSRPYRPSNVDFEHPRVFDSDTILQMDKLPRTMTVFGAGVVGCEYASMFRNLNVKMNLVNGRERLLDFLDDEISDALSYHLREQGVVIRHQESFQRLELGEDDVVLHLESGKQLKSDAFLWANGRTGNSDRLKLENVGLEADSRGYLETSRYGQTKIPSIYAAGDLVGFPSLASAAYTQGRTAANHILGNEVDDDLAGDFPTGIYTSPEISSVGKTERELTAAKIPYEIGHVQFKDLARAQITGRRVGMLKLLFHRETLQLLGVHCFGPNASEIIHIGHAVMSRGKSDNSIMYFINTTFNYPTMAEAYRVAALNGYNRLA